MRGCIIIAGAAVDDAAEAPGAANALRTAALFSCASSPTGPAADRETGARASPGTSPHTLRRLWPPGATPTALTALALPPLLLTALLAGAALEEAARLADPAAPTGRGGGGGEASESSTGEWIGDTGTTVGTEAVFTGLRAVVGGGAGAGAPRDASAAASAARAAAAAPLLWLFFNSKIHGGSGGGLTSAPAVADAAPFVWLRFTSPGGLGAGGGISNCAAAEPPFL